ncbi:MAG: ACT domain-containing protein [Candidatus Hodarchaeales archaeon]|jgi:hypothetical protein
MKDLTISISNKAGSLADLGEVLGLAGINIEGLCGFPIEKQLIVHILVKDASTARDALLKANIDVMAEREVIVFSKSEKKIVGKPGSFGELCRRLASAGINIDLAYAAENNRFVFGVDDIEEARNSLLLN